MQMADRVMLHLRMVRCWHAARSILPHQRYARQSTTFVSKLVCMLRWPCHPHTAVAHSPCVHSHFSCHPHEQTVLQILFIPSRTCLDCGQACASCSTVGSSLALYQRPLAPSSCCTAAAAERPTMSSPCSLSACVPSTGDSLAPCAQSCRHTRASSSACPLPLQRSMAVQLL